MVHVALSEHVGETKFDASFHQFSPVSHEICPTPSRPSTDLDRQHPPNTGTTCIASVRPEVFEVGDSCWTIPHYFDDLAIQTDINILKPLFQVDFKLPRLITRGYGPFLKAQSPNDSELVSGCGENHQICSNQVHHEPSIWWLSVPQFSSKTPNPHPSPGIQWECWASSWPPPGEQNADDWLFIESCALSWGISGLSDVGCSQNTSGETASPQSAIRAPKSQFAKKKNGAPGLWYSENMRLPYSQSIQPLQPLLDVSRGCGLLRFYCTLSSLPIPSP